jgi:GTP-binding protein
MSAPTDERLPVVAVVGRPNVGKSSLVNRILGRREAIVEETPGVTRDRRHFTAEWAGRSFEIVDTGGIEPGREGRGQGLDALVAEQASRAMESADLILMVVDASTGPTEDDLALAERLRSSPSPILVVANKVDGDRDEPSIADFWSLGLGEPHPVSALHGRRSGDLLARIVEGLPDRHGVGEGDWASVAIVGRPNVGKSSLVNALLGETRSIVDSVPGTTRDPIDSILETSDGRRLRLVDTAGMRRQVALKDPLEYFSWLRSRKTLTRVDVAVLVVDVSDGVTGLDQRLAEAVVESGRACVIVLNKWDLLDDEEERERFERGVRRKLRFLHWARFARTSALTRRGVDRLLPAVIAAAEAHRHRLPTAEVNRILADAQARRPHPRTGGKSIRVLYASQARTAPPTFVLFANARLQPTYLRHLERAIRESTDEAFSGTPLKLEVRVKNKPRPEP